MSHEHPHPPLHNDVYRDELIAFVREGGYSQEEYFRAHELALGVPEEETETKGEVSSRVRNLSEKISRLFEERMPVTVSAEIVDTLVKLESVPEHLHDLIASLQLSDTEKGILTSIFEKKRCGELTVYVQGSDRPKFNVSISPTVWDNAIKANELAIRLASALHSFQGTPLELTWSE